MRIISFDPSISSPIRHLLDSVHLAVVNVAPEKENLFDKTFPEFHLIYVDSREWIVNVDTKQKEIRISTFAMEFLWVLCFAHYRIYTQLVQGRKMDAGAEIDLNSSPAVGEAIQLLRWAIELQFWRSDSPWPSQLPRPYPNPPAASDEKVADELTLGAIASLVHHELAHIALGHSGKSELDSERDADAHMWDWILPVDQKIPDDQIKKRLLFLVCAHIVLVIPEIKNRKAAAISHPRGIDRLFNLLGRYELPAGHVALAFAFSIIHFHLEVSGAKMPAPDEPFDGFDAAFDAAIDHISRFETVY